MYLPMGGAQPFGGQISPDFISQLMKIRSGGMPGMPDAPGMMAPIPFEGGMPPAPGKGGFGGFNPTSMGAPGAMPMIRDSMMAALRGPLGQPGYGAPAAPTPAAPRPMFGGLGAINPRSIPGGGFGGIIGRLLDRAQVR